MWRFLKYSQDPAARIVRIVPGFAAHNSGRFQLGDMLTAIEPSDKSGLHTSASHTAGEIRRLTIGPVGVSVTLHMIRGPEAPLMLRGLLYTVKLRRCQPPAGSPADAAAMRSLKFPAGVPGPSIDGPDSPQKPASTLAATAAAAAAELMQRVQSLVVGGATDDAEREAGEGIRAGYEYFFV